MPESMAPPAPDDEELSSAELRDTWALLSCADRLLGFRMLPRAEADELFLGLPARDQVELLAGLSTSERMSWMRLLPPDDAADVIQEAPRGERERLLATLDEPTRKEVAALLAYAEDAAGGLMNPRYARARPDMTADEAISYVRRQSRQRLETLYYVYVLDEQQRVQGVASLRDLFMAPPDDLVRDIMQTDVVTVSEQQDQEQVGHLFAEHDLVAIPVVDADGRMKGIVTIDDIVDVVQEEVTEDMQKLGGMAALDTPYLQTNFGHMLKKRGGWLAVLFFGEMLTATAMAHFEHDLARAVVLALFVPLIISSGGNSGSQASTLVIRAMALGEVRLRDWWHVMRRELATGLVLGALLGTIGFLRVVGWHAVTHVYGAHYLGVALAVSVSLVGVVTFGTLVGSLLPFLLRRLGLDPASASVPFVATLVDVMGLVIYFSAANVFLRGTLL